MLQFDYFSNLQESCVILRMCSTLNSGKYSKDKRVYIKRKCFQFLHALQTIRNIIC